MAKEPKRKRTLKRQRKPKPPQIDFSKCGRCGSKLSGTLTFQNNMVMCKPCNTFLKHHRKVELPPAGTRVSRCPRCQELILGNRHDEYCAPVRDPNWRDQWEKGAFEEERGDG